MRIRSITTKFIVIISVLMALIMAIQLYYNNKMQEDVLLELNRLKHSINSTTDRILVEQLEPGALPVLSDSAVWKNDWQDEFNIDEEEIVINGKSIVRPNIKSLPEGVWQEKMPPIKVIDSLRHHAVKALNVTVDKSHKMKSFFQFNKTVKDSSAGAIKIFEYNLNVPRTDKQVNAFVSTSDTSGDEDVISFEFPNLIFSDEPGKFRYNYSTARFNTTLEDIRDRNLLLTLGLFAVSLVMIAAVTGKFLKPIKSLNQSFDKVVRGDLDVVVKPRSMDEIGELSASFNHMVNELRKNRDKEELSHRQQRLASLGQLAAGVAHEIKNPLNAINLTIEHLNDKFVHASEKQAVAYIHTIQKEIQRLDKTVNNLLSYLRSENLHKKESDVNMLLDEVLHLYEREMNSSNITLKKEYAPACIINLDAERFKTVVMNVITNAIQALSDGGEIKVTTNSRQKSVTIEDNGQGIPQKNLQSIFDLFYTTKSAGSGLGLPTAHKIMQEHGGSITIHSKEKQGTQVVITFN